MKTGLQDRLRRPQRDRVAPDTRPMTGSISNQQPSTIRGEAQQDLRDASDRLLIRLGGEIVVGEAVVVEGDGGGHDVLAVAGDSVATSAWDLGDEAVAAEFDDEP